MSDFVSLRLKRNRGWPWPERSWGLSSMFGPDGWCEACGVPQVPQCGPLTLQRKGMAAAKGAWTPNWQFDAICLDSRAAEGIADRFDVDLRRVAWRGLPPGDVFQIVVPSLGHAWFDPEALREAARAQHGGDGAQCADCGVWRWMPLEVGLLPALRVDPPLGEVDIAASPEWFGDGWNAFRQILMRRALAASIVAAGPQDFEVHEVG